MILTDPDAIRCEQELMAWDPTLRLLRNDRLKSWVVVQDLRTTNHGHQPWQPRPPGLEGVIGIGPVTFFHYLAEFDHPNAAYIIRALAMNSRRLSTRVNGKSGIEALQEERETIREKRFQRSLEPVREINKDLWTYGRKGRKSVLISRS